MSAYRNTPEIKPSPVEGMKRTGSGNLKCTYCGTIYGSQMNMEKFYQQHIDQHKLQIRLANEREERQKESRRYALQKMQAR